MTGLQMDEHIARIALNQGATPQVKIYLTDALGNVIATTKADQSLEVGYAFSPYGYTQKAGWVRTNWLVVKIPPYKKEQHE